MKSNLTTLCLLGLTVGCGTGITPEKQSENEFNSNDEYQDSGYESQEDTNALDQEDTGIPENLKKFQPSILDKKLLVNYDKKITKLKEIIEILNQNKISFSEINTQESDLEDVFMELIKND